MEVLESVLGGGGSLAQTLLWLHFPANREINNECAVFGLIFWPSL